MPIEEWNLHACKHFHNTIHRVEQFKVSAKNNDKTTQFGNPSHNQANCMWVAWALYFFSLPSKFTSNGFSWISYILELWARPCFQPDRRETFNLIRVLFLISSCRMQSVSQLHRDNTSKDYRFVAHDQNNHITRFLRSRKNDAINFIFYFDFETIKYHSVVKFGILTAWWDGPLSAPLIANI